MIILFVILFLCFFSSPALATDIMVTCPNDPDSNPTSLKCTLNPNNVPLFDEQKIAPGYLSPLRIVTVDNLDQNNPCFLKTSTLKSSGDDLLLEGTYRLNLSITDGTQVLYSGPLIFPSQNLGQVDIGSTKNYYWTVSFPQQAGNDYQTLSAVFDINLNFNCAGNSDWQPPVTNPASGVYLSEYMPKGNEWVELFNNNNYDVILDGWWIDDLMPGGQSARQIPYTTISAHSFFVFEIGSGFLNDGGDDVNLLDNLGQLVENTSYGQASDTLSWSRQSNGVWCLADPSRGSSNKSCFNPDDNPGGDGQVLSATNQTVSSPSCNDAVPGTPSNLSATANGGQVSLTWDQVSPPYTSYLIAYGPTETDIKYGNPNIGLNNFYTVSGLTPTAQYCFYVRAQNGCMPGLASNIVCVNQGSTIPVAEITPASGFQPEVLGENTNENQPSAPVDLPDIMGTTTIHACQSKYIPLLFIIALLVNSLYFFKFPKGNRILPILVSLSTTLIDWFILKKSCCLIPSIFCQYFFIGNLLSFIIPSLVFKKKPN